MHKDRLKKRASQLQQPVHTGTGALFDMSPASSQPPPSTRKGDACQKHIDEVVRRVREEVENMCPGCVMARVSKNEKTGSWTLDHVQAVVR